MILVFLYIVLFAVLIYRMPFFKNELIHRGAISGVFILKVAAGFFLTWIYTKYYTDRQAADIYKYFDDSKILFSAFENHKYSDFLKMLSGIANDNAYFDTTYYSKMNNWNRVYDFSSYNDNHTIIRFNALVLLFSFGNFYVHTLFMCFVSLLGLTALYKAFVIYFKDKEKLLFMAIFLVPSVLFWGSGVLKEGILLFALGFLFYSFFNIFLYRKNILVNTVPLSLSVFLLLINKNYLLFAAAPALICFYIVQQIKFFKPIVFYLIIYTIGFIGAILFNDNLWKNLSLKQRDFINVSQGGVYLQNSKHFARIAPDKKIYLDTISNKIFKIKPGSSYIYWNNANLEDTIFVTNSTDTARFTLLWDLPLAGSTININKLEPNASSVFKNVPNALYNSLCKPGLFSSKTFLEKISAVENAFVLLFLVLCTWFCKRIFNKNVLGLSMFISLVILLLIGFTTPVAGAIVRYKVPVLPFILMCGIIVLDENRFKFLTKNKVD